MTQFATIQSQPFEISLLRAFTSTLSVSAANPTTSLGRPSSILAIVAKMSGFSTSSSDGTVRPFCFLIFEPLKLRTPQSATAAANIAASAGSASCTTFCISLADSTWTTQASAGGSTEVGPVMNVTLAPRRRSASAIAVPCFPEDLFAM